MENSGNCKNCGHSLESHNPDFGGTGRIQKCGKCDCQGYEYPI